MFLFSFFLTSVYIKQNPRIIHGLAYSYLWNSILADDYSILHATVPLIKGYCTWNMDVMS